MKKVAVLFLFLNLALAFADPDRFTDPGVYSATSVAKAGTEVQ